MRIDSNYLSSTASANNEQQRVRSARHGMESQDELSAGHIQQRGAVPHVPTTPGISRTARPSDTAHISGVSASLNELATAVHTAADVRHSKVQSLREAVDSGTYQLSPERIAESMLAQVTTRLR